MAHFVILSDDDDDELERRQAEDVLKIYGPEDFEDFDAEMTKAEVAKLEGSNLFDSTSIQWSDSYVLYCLICGWTNLTEDQERSPADLGVLEEYAMREAEFMARAADLEETTKARDQAKQLLEDLNQQRLEEFMWGFQIISGKLKEMYQVYNMGLCIRRLIGWERRSWGWLIGFIWFTTRWSPWAVMLN